MQFYETKMGQQFFQGQLPALLSVLQRIAKSLEQPTKAIRLSSEVPKEYLNNLYYGNLEPDSQVDNETIRRYAKDTIDLHNEIQHRLSPEDLILVEQLQQTMENRATEEAEQAFQVGFRTAMQMVAAGLSMPINGIRNSEVYPSKNSV